MPRCILACTLLFSCGGQAEDEGEKRDPAAGGSGGQSSGGDANGGSPSSGGAASGGDSGSGASGGADSGGSGGDSTPPENVGHVDESCGAYMWSLDEQTFLDCSVEGEHEFHPDCIIVDCTAHGDVDAICVFSNHCMCSDDFACEGSKETVGSECAPRSSCVPIE